jgi:hypothetical protein
VLGREKFPVPVEQGISPLPIDFHLRSGTKIGPKRERFWKFPVIFPVLRELTTPQTAGPTSGQTEAESGPAHA